MDRTAAGRTRVAAASSSAWRWLPAGAAGYGLLLWLLLPAGIIAINDDFGYLRSVIATVQHGRPWTDDWLEPWAASLSSLAAIIFRTTGSFSLAVHGLLSVLAAGTFATACLLLRERGLALKAAMLVAALGLTFPVMLWKTVEFTGVALYLPCLLLALWSAGRQRWGLFFVAWALAVATRQSAVVWLLLPLWSVGRALTGPRADRSVRNWIDPLAVVGVGALIFWAIDQSMNRTHAQAMLTEHAFRHIIPIQAASTLVLGGFVYLCAAGGGAWLLRSSSLAVRVIAAPPVKVVFFGLLLIALFSVDQRPWFESEHTLFAGTLGWLYLKAVGAIAILGWLRGGFRLRGDHAFFAFGLIALIAVRPQTWDYYFLDVALVGFFGVATSSRGTAPAQPSGPALRWPLAVLASFHLLFFLDLKCILDRVHALCDLSEKALREGKLQPAELSFAPFGFAGWHLHPYSIAHEGKTSGDIASFGRYFRPGAIEVGQGYPKILRVLPRFRHVPPTDRSNLVASGRYRFAWFFHAEFFLLRFKSEAEQSAELPLPRTEYRLQPFPLNDVEWRALVNPPPP